MRKDIAMTTEEKAKAYDEALSQARFYYGNCPTEPEKKKLEKLFPELRENEDEKIRKEIINFLETIPISELKRVPRPICQWFFWLEKQKEQKPAEWSEEDEKMLNNMIKVLDGYIEISGDTRREFSKWLKSLHPSWKPSEEQIQALEYVVSSIPPNYLKEQEYMMTLIGQVIQQLKKL